MSTDFERIIRLNSERIADLRKTTADIERDVAAARGSLEREFARAVRTAEESPAYFRGACQCGADHGQGAPDPGSAWVPFPAPRQAFDDEARDLDCPVHSAEERTAVLLNSGRSTAGRRRLPRGGLSAAGAVLAVALVAILVMALSGGGASLAGQRGPDGEPDRHGMPEPGRQVGAGPGQLRLRQVHPADPVGVRADDQRRERHLRGPEDRAGRPGADRARPGRRGGGAP